MKFELSEEQKMLQTMARDFAQKEVLPKAAEIDREHRHPKELVARMAELGLMGVAVPEELGGSGMDNVSYALAMEEISRACASTGVIMSVNNSLVCDPIMRFGDDAQKRAFLAPLASGEKLGCFALSEPEAGSDAAAQRTTAVRDGDEWVIQGTKNWITNGPVADTMVLFAMTDKEQGHRGISSFIVPMDTAGVRCGEPDDKLGIRGSKSSQVFLDDARLPASALLGEVGGGFKVAMSTLDGGRIGIAGQALGIARAALEDALDYSLNRKTMGKPIAKHQAISFKLADMATELDAARLLTLRAAYLKDSGQPYGKAAAMAKLYASDVANRAAREAIQIFGGNGYVTEYPVERHFRDAKITEIYEGTSEIQRLVIANHLFKEHA
ncbi:acyl-CoA dehydrogenase [Haliangium ochraceum]|uniref:Cyclohexane-1-carbonyl-CoA dehydrogenase n=1 Tax=Haliangium ochraceum (strain DSM 14365 / JCM 11303 / SMP-2) TaxID=502025 RepID=D0LYC8_HALO1|nr:acyl-CoA dehydrogenase [Haliangium ochraceum]ACY16278.1 acyl-CoA dehydrogenase domain protein [Haliangium ochraceum DSM 14365]